MTVLGRAVIRVDGLQEAITRMIQEDRRDRKESRRSDIWAQICNDFGNDEDSFLIMKNLYESTIDFSFWVKEDQIEKNILDRAAELFDKTQKMISRSKAFSSPIKCLYSCDLFKVVSLGSEKSSMLLPGEFVTVTPYKDYESFSASERRMMLGSTKEESSETSVAVYGGSIAEARAQQEETAVNVAALEQQIKDVEEAKTAELAAMQSKINEMVAELEAKKAKMKSSLDQQLSEMKLQVKKMKFQIHLMESEVYAIRCYTGEIVEFHKIRDGRPASKDTPLVFYQKLRYLDEELGRLASIYGVDFSKYKVFDELLKYSPTAFDLFAPSERCIMLARVSKSNKQFRASEDYVNVLTDYEVYHGKRICIILRDGENLWTAWTDDDRVNFSEDAFLRPSEARPMTEEEAKKWEKGNYESEEKYNERIERMKMQNLDEGLSRMFVFSILQGVIDRGMISFPEKVNIQKSSQNVIFSYAEGWLDDNRFGSLSDILERTNKTIAKGDAILTVQSLRAEPLKSSSGYCNQTWHNDRGIGEKNRTHDVYCSDRTIYPINKVVHMADYVITYTDTNGVDKDIIRDVTMTDEELSEVLKKGRWGHYKVASYECTGHDVTRYYISLEKDGYFRDTESRANFRVYRDEFWNLTYLNSVVIKYLLSTKKTDGVHIGGTRVDFAHVIPYLKTALEHVQAREEEFSEWLKEVAPDVLNDTEWPAQLSDWMLERKIHNFSSFRAKQFAKWYEEKNNAGA